MKQPIESEPASALQLRIEAESKRRLRPSQWQKDWATLHGLKLRGRGRPRRIQRAENSRA